MNKIIEKIKQNKKVVYDNLIFYHIAKTTLSKYAENLKYFRIISFDNKCGSYASNKFYITFGEEA